MKFQMTHVFACTPGEYWDLLDTQEFEDLQAKESNVARAVREQRTNADGSRFKRVRCVPRREWPAVMKSFLGPEGLVYDQVNETYPEKNLLKWRVEVQKVGDRVHVEGTTVLRAHPDGCERTLAGEIRVSVPFVGGKIEQAVGQDFERSFQRTAEAIRRFIAERKA